MMNPVDCIVAIDLLTNAWQIIHVHVVLDQ